MLKSEDTFESKGPINFTIILCAVRTNMKLPYSHQSVMDGTYSLPTLVIVRFVCTLSVFPQS